MMWKFLFIVCLTWVNCNPLQNEAPATGRSNLSRNAGQTCRCPPSATTSDRIGSSVGANQPMSSAVSNIGANFYQYFVLNDAILCESSPTPVHGPSVQPEVVKRDDYTYTPGVGAHKFHRRAVIWNEARKSCDAEGGHLAIINSVAEAQILGKILNDSEPVTGANWPFMSWLGFHNFYNDGEWVTILGESLADTGFQKWERGEPNNANGQQHCGALDKFEGLCDMTCTRDFLPFICELIIA